MPATDLPELMVGDQAAWRKWLGRHHRDGDGVWLVMAKKGVTQPTSLTYQQALEEALCHGWIDGQRDRRDATTFRQLFSPRRSRSRWSKQNVGRVERLIDEKRMHPAGVAEVERAKADGRWEVAYEGQGLIEIPDDLAAALSGQPRAQAMFEILTSQNRYSILFRIHGAKRADTRARRVDEFVAMLARGETIHPQRRTLED